MQQLKSGDIQQEAAWGWSGRNQALVSPRTSARSQIGNSRTPPQPCYVKTHIWNLESVDEMWRVSSRPISITKWAILSISQENIKNWFLFMVFVFFFVFPIELQTIFLCRNCQAKSTFRTVTCGQVASLTVLGDQLWQFCSSQLGLFSNDLTLCGFVHCKGGVLLDHW